MNVFGCVPLVRYLLTAGFIQSKNWQICLNETKFSIKLLEEE